MRSGHLAAITVLVTLSLASAVGTAEASRNATRSQAKALAQAVRNSPVGGIDKVPTKRYKVTKVRISTVSRAWARASLVPTKAFRNVFQPSIAVAVQPAGTSRWVVVDLGTAEVGCGIAPNAVLFDLFELMSGESPCPTGEGIS